MNQEDIVELEKLLNQVINAYTKSEGKKPLARLEFLAAQIKPQVSGYAAEKLSQAVGYAKSASGSVQNKEHWKNNANQAWYLFEREVNIED